GSFVTVSAPPLQPLSANAARDATTKRRGQPIDKTRFMLTVSSIARAGGSGVGKHARQIEAIGILDVAGALGDLAVVARIARRAEAHRTEHLLHLALRERIALRELASHRFRASTVARQRRGPPEQGVLPGKSHPVLPLIGARDIAWLEVVGIDQVLRLDGSGRVHELSASAERLVEVVVRKCLRHRVHDAVTAETVVQKHAAVAARAARDVLANA